MNKKPKRKKGSGGARKGAGRKRKFTEQTKYYTVLLPVSKIEEIKLHIRNQMLKWK